MGGLGRIYFRSLSDYAERFGIAGAAFEEFVTLMRVIDDEYVAHATEKAAAEAEKNKT